MAISNNIKAILGSKNVKDEGVIGRLEKYLVSLQNEDNDRAFNVNAPSQIGGCLRARYYSRTNTADSEIYNARTQRIFDNGSGVHVRLQTYMHDAGILLMDEVPVFSKKYNIQGHTDGIIKINENELGIIEIKSMNDFQFSKLKEEKPEHKMQGLTYEYCVETHRKELKARYKGIISFIRSAKEREKEYAEMYQHLKGGSHYTKEEKIDFQVSLHMKLDSILFSCKLPITKVIFLYEDKNNQELKEFLVSSTQKDGKKVIEQILEECDYLNKCVETSVVPEREGKNKSDSICRFCPYKSDCWVV